MNTGIGEKIRELRMMENMTQETLAERLNISFQSIRRWENGKYNPSLELMIRYAHALGCELKVELVPMED
ncbi:MAG: helix-turn-helix transcriptional regulator [Acetatifactor sp.]